MNKATVDLPLGESEPELPYEDYLDDFAFYTQTVDASPGKGEDDAVYAGSSSHLPPPPPEETAVTPARGIKNTLRGMFTKRSRVWRSEGALTMVPEHSSKNRSADGIAHSNDGEAMSSIAERNIRQQSSRLNSATSTKSHSPLSPPYIEGDSPVTATATDSSGSSRGPHRLLKSLSKTVPPTTESYGSSPTLQSETAVSRGFSPSLSMDMNRSHSWAESPLSSQSGVALWGPDLMKEINSVTKTRARAATGAMDASPHGADSATPDKTDEIAPTVRVRTHKKSQSVL